ncbi:MAG: NAD-binding protein [Candidatus Bruticola sp.]
MREAGKEQLQNSVPIGTKLDLARQGQKPKALLVGLGRTGQEVAKRLLNSWQLIAVDKDEKTVSACRQSLGEEGIEFICGDVSSLLVLRRAKANEVKMAVSILGDDEATEIFCLLMRHEFDIAFLYAQVVNEKNVDKIKQLGVEVSCRSSAMASVLAAQIDSSRKIAGDIGLGIGEISEIKILPNSAVIGRSLMQLHPQSYLVGAIYRKGKLVVPHGQTVFEADDRVVLIGDPAVLPRIANYFRSGFSSFPMPYGSKFMTLGYEEKPPVEVSTEAAWLAESVKDKESIVEPLIWQAPNIKQPELHKILEEQDCGCLAVADAPFNMWQLMGLFSNKLMDILNRANRPCLIARGSCPYRRIVHVVTPRHPRSLELALVLVRSLGLSFICLAVKPEEMVAGEEQNDELQNSLQRAVKISSLYSVTAESVCLEGNPVHKVTEFLQDSDLLVIAHRQNHRFSLMAPDVSRQIIMRSKCSVMVLPHGGGADYARATETN